MEQVKVLSMLSFGSLDCRLQSLIRWHSLPLAGAWLALQSGVCISLTNGPHLLHHCVMHEAKATADPLDVRKQSDIYCTTDVHVRTMCMSA